MPVKVAGWSPARRARVLGLSGPSPGEEVKALQVGGLEIEAGADAVVEQRQLGAQVPQ